MTEVLKAAAEARKRIGQIVHGQDDSVRLLFVALAADGHVLLEGIPGVGKTTLANTFAKVIGLKFRRVQLTPDLMPSDITGHMFYNQKDQEFELREGPVFTNILLADELNRTPPRTQAALLEVMQEQQATIEGQTYKLPQPFMVVATKNPIEVEGVYTLPEAELDRFMVHIPVAYPGRAVEKLLLAGKLKAQVEPKPVKGLVPLLREAAGAVFVHEDLQDYLLDLAQATRDHQHLELGASPRAVVQFQAATRAWAALEGRDYAIPDDIKALAFPVLGHRVLRTADAEADGVTAKEIIDEILAATKVPIQAKR